jgi:hypothetical protein
MKIAECLLLDGLAARPQPVIPGPGCGELTALLQVSRCAVAPAPPPRLLLDREVPHKPGVGAVLPHHNRLLRRGCQQVAGHKAILLSTISERGERRFLPGINVGISAPQL